MLRTSGPWFAWVGVALVALGIGVVLGRVARRSFRRYRTLRTVDHVDAGGVEAGDVVAVRGTAVSLGETVRSYFADTDALVRRTRIARVRGSSTERGGYKLDWFHDGYAAVPFEVSDATGAVRVDPPNDHENYGDLAAFRLSIDPGGFEADIESEDALAEQRRAYDADHDLRHSLTGRSNLRIRERVLEPDDGVYVVGRATSGPDGRPVVSGVDDPGAFAVTHDLDGVHDALARSALTQSVTVGAFATVATLVGTGALLVALFVAPS